MSHKHEANESDIVSFAFNRKKIRYNVLEDLVSDSLIDTTATMFIDVRYILDIMRIEYYKDAVTRELVPSSNRVIAELLNLVVHYKRYLTEKRSCRAEFVLMFDSGLPDPAKMAINELYGSVRTGKTVKPSYLGFLANKVQRIASCIPGLRVVNSRERDLTCIPLLVKDKLSSIHNLFLSDDPLFHEISSEFRNFLNLRANGEYSRSIPRNKFFRHLFEKNKWTVKKEEETAIDDSYVRLFLNLVGGDDECAVDDFKNKKAVNLINKIRQSETKFINYSAVKGLVSDEAMLKLEERDFCYNVFAHASAVDDAERLDILAQFNDCNRTSRKEFNHYNLEYFGGIVEESVLFSSI
jgi:hypothetical protein